MGVLRVNVAAEAGGNLVCLGGAGALGYLSIHGSFSVST